MSQYVLNAASLRPDETNSATGRSLTIALIETLAELDVRLEGPVRPLKLPQYPWDLILSRNASEGDISLGSCVDDLYSSPETYQLAVFFDALQQHAPAVEHLDDATIDAILRLVPNGPVVGFEAVFQAVVDAECDAMQCAVTGGTLVSLDFPPWDFDQAAVMCGETRVELDHASQIFHVDAIVARHQDAILTSLTQRNFNSLRERAFPSLVWGQNIETQISVFPAQYLELSFKKLATLEVIAREWQSSGTQLPDFNSLEIKPESDLTMQNFSAARRFRASDGEMQTFELHFNVSQGTRIHVRLDEDARAIEVGYIGVHLPTWRFH